MSTETVQMDLPGRLGITVADSSYIIHIYKAQMIRLKCCSRVTQLHCFSDIRDEPKNMNISTHCTGKEIDVLYRNWMHIVKKNDTSVKSNEKVV